MKISWEFENLNKPLAYILGVYFSDGTIVIRPEQHDYRFALYVMDKDFACYTLTCLHDVIFKDVAEQHWKLSEMADGRWMFQAGCKDFVLWLAEITEGKRKIPDFILDANKVHKRAFIAGIMDGDGWICERAARKGLERFQMGYAKSYAFFHEVVWLMRNIGIKVGKMRRQPSKNRILWRCTINIRSFLRAGCYFIIARKQERLERYHNESISPEITKGLPTREDGMIRTS